MSTLNVPHKLGPLVLSAGKQIQDPPEHLDGVPDHGTGGVAMTRAAIMRGGTAVGLVLGLLASRPAVVAAQEEHGAEASHEEHEFHRHHLALFLGASTKPEAETDSKTAFTFGVGYEFRVQRRWGVGAFVEGLPDPGDRKRAAVAAAAFFVHPVGELRLVAAPGVEFTQAMDSEVGTQSAEAEGDEASFLLRLGAAYEFRLGRFSIAPEFNLDLVKFEEAVLVYGLGFGVGF